MHTSIIFLIEISKQSQPPMAMPIKGDLKSRDEPLVQRKQLRTFEYSQEPVGTKFESQIDDKNIKIQKFPGKMKER